MDTAPDATNATDPKQRPMDEDKAPASPFRFPQPDFQAFQFHFDDTATALEQQQMAEIHAKEDSVATNSSNESLKSQKLKHEDDDHVTNKPDDDDEADDEGDSDDEVDEDADDEKESESPDDLEESDASDNAMTPRVLYTAEAPEGAT